MAGRWYEVSSVRGCNYHICVVAHWTLKGVAGLGRGRGRGSVEDSIAGEGGGGINNSPRRKWNGKNCRVVTGQWMFDCRTGHRHHPPAQDTQANQPTLTLNCLLLFYLNIFAIYFNANRKWKSFDSLNQGLCRLGLDFFSNGPENIYLHQTK